MIGDVQVNPLFEVGLARGEQYGRRYCIALVYDEAASSALMDWDYAPVYDKNIPNGAQSVEVRLPVKWIMNMRAPKP